MKSIKNIQLIKWVIIGIITIIYLRFSLAFGFWLTGDLHSGGPLIGVFLTPILFLIIVIIFFYRDIKIRNKSVLILLTFSTFIISLILVSYIVDEFALKILKEYYLIYEYSFWINLIVWTITIILTFLVYKILNIKLSTKNG